MPAWAGQKGNRWELGVWSLDSEPQGTFLGMENAWEGEIPERGKFPRAECLSLAGIGTKCARHPCLAGTGGMAFLVCLWVDTVIAASSERLVLSSCTGGRASVTPLGLPSKSPQEQWVFSREM